MSSSYPPFIVPKHDRWIMQVPVISTSHFTRAQCDELYRSAFLKDSEFSCILCLEDYTTEFDDQPAEVLAVFKFFHELGYRHLRLDPDGDVVPELPTHDW